MKLVVLEGVGLDRHSIDIGGGRYVVLSWFQMHFPAASLK